MDIRSFVAGGIIYCYPCGTRLHPLLNTFNASENDVGFMVTMVMPLSRCRSVRRERGRVGSAIRVSVRGIEFSASPAEQELQRLREPQSSQLDSNNTNLPHSLPPCSSEEPFRLSPGVPSSGRLSLDHSPPRPADVRPQCFPVAGPPGETEANKL